MNVDETTYQFSPKVLDRASTVEFRVATEALMSATTIDDVTEAAAATRDEGTWHAGVRDVAALYEQWVYLRLAGVVDGSWTRGMRRDAIRRTAGAFVVYPGDDPKRFARCHEVLPGLGTLPPRADRRRGVGARRG